MSPMTPTDKAIDNLQKRVVELEAEIERLREIINLPDESGFLRKENSLLQTTLEFYANENNWTILEYKTEMGLVLGEKKTEIFELGLMSDKGDRARKALGR